MKARKSFYLNRMIYSNINSVARTAGLSMILIPVLFLVSSFVFSFDIFQLEAILPIISLEAVSLVYFFISTGVLPQAKKMSKPRFKWVYMSFWLIVLNVALLNVRNTGDIAMSYMLFAGASLLVAMVPSLDGMEYLACLACELVWMFISALPGEGQLMDFAAYGGTILVCGLISRYNYKNRVDICIMKQRMRGITKDALVDPLTGLLNRRGFDQQVASIWPFCVRNDYKVALMIIDIDNFKLFNDEYGHPEGDECLRQVAACIRKTAKRTTDVVARIGGEEFLVFIQGSKDTEMVEFANLIRKNVEKLAIGHSMKAGYPFVTVSIGLEIAAPKGLDIGMMYEGADAELYKAKEGGRNAVSYSGRVKRKFSVLA